MQTCVYTVSTVQTKKGIYKNRHGLIFVYYVLVRVRDSLFFQQVAAWQSKTINITYTSIIESPNKNVSTFKMLKNDFQLHLNRSLTLITIC